MISLRYTIHLFADGHAVYDHQLERYVAEGLPSHDAAQDAIEHGFDVEPTDDDADDRARLSHMAQERSMSTYGRFV